MGSHNDSPVVLELSREEALFLLKCIYATPLQGSLGTIAPTVSVGTGLLERLQSLIEEHEKRHLADPKTG